MKQRDSFLHFREREGTGIFSHIFKGQKERVVEIVKFVFGKSSSVESMAQKKSNVNATLNTLTRLCN